MNKIFRVIKWGVAGAVLGWILLYICSHYIPGNALYSIGRSLGVEMYETDSSVITFRIETWIFFISIFAISGIIAYVIISSWKNSVLLKKN